MGLVVVILSSCLDFSNAFVPTILLSKPLGTSTSHHHATQQPQSSSSSSTSTTPLEFKSEKKAGEEGYSILRRPLDWETESDPRFDTPLSLDASMDAPQRANSDWFGEKAYYGKATTKGRQQQDVNGNGGLDIPHGVGTSQTRTMEFDQELDLKQRTLDTLDYPMVLKALLKECGTAPAKRIVQGTITIETNDNDDDSNNDNNNKPKPKQDNDDDETILTMGLTAPHVEGVHNRYQALTEMKYILSNPMQVPATRDFKDGNNSNTKPDRNPKTQNQKKRRLGMPPLTSEFDIAPMFQKVDAGQVLDGPDILETSTILQACRKVRYWCNDLEQIDRKRQQSEILDDTTTMNTSDFFNGPPPFVHVPRFGHAIHIEEELLDLLSNAFDDEGKLSGTTFPTIGRLRSKVRLLKKDILSTLDALISSPSVKNKISMESGGALVSEVNGRIVIPISESYKNSVGIIHDASRSGKTSYVEPTEVVGPTNEMRQAELDLKKEEGRVWRMLTKAIMDQREDIERSIAAVAQIDLILARIRLGDRLAGVIPEVKDEGVISLRNARHPVLLLRELDNVVGSDIDIGYGENQGLVRFH